ncbi:hypothetical protein VKT23_013655 [Stygiomarasmius scandens]|uniref:Uncharacterized protein n=1 Tax=Marasmiellus scandens TaxID=2682957 RepID=A0ABR1J5P1_9AGAR
MKREHEHEDLPDTKRARRDAFSAAESRILEAIGPGGFLDSQTSDTQYFNFSQSSGNFVPGENESQPHYVAFPGDAGDDWYGIPKIQSQLPEDYSTGEETDKLAAMPLECKQESPPPSDSCKWGPNTANQLKLEQALAIEYKDRHLILDLIENREDSENVRQRWQIMRQDETDRHPARLALLRLMREAGILEHGFHTLNPLRQGHCVVSSFLMRVANHLICDGGQAQNTSDLKDMIDDAHVLLELASELVNLETDLQRQIEAE